VCTAHQDRKNVAAAIQAGANDFLCKPIDRRMIQGRIEKHLKKSKAEQETPTN
jgi:DNA-binding response OmpR family regulator